MNWKASLRRLQKWLQSDDGWTLQVCMAFVVIAYLFGYCTSWAGTRLDMSLKDHYMRQLTESWLKLDEEVRKLRPLAAASTTLGKEAKQRDAGQVILLETPPTGVDVMGDGPERGGVD